MDAVPPARTRATAPAQIVYERAGLSAGRSERKLIPLIRLGLNSFPSLRGASLFSPLTSERRGWGFGGRK